MSKEKRFDCDREQIWHLIAVMSKLALTGGSVAGEVHNLQSLLISKQINSSTPPRRALDKSRQSCVWLQRSKQL